MNRGTQVIGVGLLLVATRGVVEAEAQDLDKPRADAPVAIARRTTEAIRVDGRLDEIAWQSAEPIGPMRQREPIEDGEPSEETSVRVLYTDSALYLGIVCGDRSRAGIISTQLTRDADLDVDDRITIVLDPFFDHRNGFFFQVNPAGARSDGQVSNNSETLTRDWDGIWNAVARITDEGWIAEIEIPFKTLRFKPGQAVWGFNIERQIKRHQEIDRWAAPRQNIWIGNLAEAGPARGSGRHAARAWGSTSGRTVSGAAERREGEFTGGVDVFQEHHTEFECRSDREHGLCRNRSRYPSGQPHAVSVVLSGETYLLPRRRRRLRHRGSCKHHRFRPFFSRRIGLVDDRGRRQRHGAVACRRQADGPAVRTTTSASSMRRPVRSGTCALPGGSSIARICWPRGSAAISCSSPGLAES